MCEQEMEGVVAKRLNEPYRPGERSWIKTKNREYWRYEMERESAFLRTPATPVRLDRLFALQARGRAALD